jgi:hypothetical protein
VKYRSGDVFAIVTGRGSIILRVSGDFFVGQVEYGNAVVGQLGHEDWLGQSGELGSGLGSGPSGESPIYAARNGTTPP